MHTGISLYTELDKLFSPSFRRQAFAAASQENSIAHPRTTGEALRNGEGSIVARRAASAWRNSPLLHSALLHYRRGVRGILRPLTRNEDAQKAFDRWARNCGFRHNHGSFTAVMSRAAHHLVQDGECFIQRVFVNNAHHVNGLLLQIWPGHQRDTGRNFQSAIDGVEFTDGLPSGVWFRSLSSIADGLGTSIKVNFRDLIWLRYAPEADQLGGLPLAHASIASDAQLADFADTSLIAARVAACTSALVIADEHSMSVRHLEMGTEVTDSQGNPIEELQPGTIPIVHGAKDVKSISPTSAVFPVEAQKARVFAGVGLTSEIAGGTTNAASYSALRWAAALEHAVIQEFAEICDWSGALDTILEWFVAAELLQGRDWSVDTWQWLPRPQISIDPEKHANAEKLEIEQGIKTVTQAIRERGRDPQEVFRERAQEQALLGTDQENDDQEQE